MAHKRNLPQVKLVNVKLKSRSLRSSNKKPLEVPKAENRKFENSFLMLAIKRWNSLSECYKSVVDDKSFKSRVKKEMIINNN